MSKLRPECVSAGWNEPALPDDTALFLIRDAVARRKELIHGRLDGPRGLHCAMGAFWADNPNAIVHNYITDEVTAVNDSVPSTASAKERWKKVNEWLRWKIKVLAQAKR